ncbi:uncharacterized protein LOC114540203 [Dendronephthya gigantea]|uniref:uncharacterized protein LOC114540203 n=1 Tax=Dendronephthya gigantea TaxID=151771 RepID=UPI0010690833|nr:uncharacterized protein LOC114540203 [Dendronephthya gigantea]
MALLQRRRINAIRDKASKPLFMIPAVGLSLACLRFSLLMLIFLIVQNFGDGLDFCFDGSKEGYRFNHGHIENIHAKSGAECAFKCAGTKGCRSVNYKKQRSCEEMENCELLAEVESNTSPLIKDKDYDHYLLLNCDGKPLDPTSSSSPTQSTTTTPTCSVAKWWLKSSNKWGWATCGEENLFITGFYRSSPNSNRVPIILLEEARCCNSTPASSGQNGQCKTVNWWFSLDKENIWSNCPEGYFLNGLQHTIGASNLHAIEYGHCCKPNNHPDQYGSCYEEDVGTSFNQAGWSNCSKPGHYIAGLNRGNGDWLNNIDKFRCCQMVAI